MDQTVSKIERKNVLYKWLSFCGIAGSILLTLAWIILGLLVPPFHNEYGINGGIAGTITSPISGIGVGPYGFIFNSAFIMTGILIMIGIFGVFLVLNKTNRIIHWIIAILLMLSPLGWIFAGIFNLSVSVPLHMAGFLLAAGTPVISFIMAGLYLRRNGNYKKTGNVLLIGSPVTLVITISCLMVFDYELIAAGGGIAGIISRLLALEVCSMYFLIGLFGMRQAKK
jgi:uncharacterized membrane protein (DUF485 family)